MFCCGRHRCWYILLWSTQLVLWNFYRCLILWQSLWFHYGFLTEKSLWIPWICLTPTTTSPIQSHKSGVSRRCSSILQVLVVPPMVCITIPNPPILLEDLQWKPWIRLVGLMSSTWSFFRKSSGSFRIEDLFRSTCFYCMKSTTKSTVRKAHFSFTRYTSKSIRFFLFDWQWCFWAGCSGTTLVEIHCIDSCR